MTEQEVESTVTTRRVRRTQAEIEAALLQKLADIKARRKQHIAGQIADIQLALTAVIEDAKELGLDPVAAAVIQAKQFVDRAAQGVA